MSNNTLIEYAAYKYADPIQLLKKAAYLSENALNV